MNFIGFQETLSFNNTFYIYPFPVNPFTCTFIPSFLNVNGLATCTCLYYLFALFL